ncbi:MAG TPA: caspase family protein [Syntrophorhabdaceae bacterium]|nr:caspase family protein [Syntrophorhabdaceae bacterium]
MTKSIRSFLLGIFVLAICLVCDLSMVWSQQCEPGTKVLSVVDTGLKKAGNTGPVSFMVYGTGFTDSTVFTLILSGGSLSTTRQAILDSERAIVTFNLSNAAPGNASIRAANGTDTGTLSNALAIESGTTGGLEIKLEGNVRLNPGELATLYVTYANSGSVDIDIPVLILKVPGASFLSTSPNGKNLGESAFILGIPQNPVYTTLRPGVSVSIPFYAKTTGTSEAKLIATDPNDPAFAGAMLDYSKLLQGPLGPTPALQQQVNQLQTDYGTNVADFYRREIQRLPDLVTQESRSQYQTVRHIDGEWDFSAPPAVQGKERPGLIDSSSLPQERPVHQQSTGITSQTSSANDGASKTWVVIISDNDYSSLTAGQIEKNPKNPNLAQVNNLNYTDYDGTRVKNLFNAKYKVPDSQIFWLKDVSGDQYTLTPTDIDNTIKNIPADGDDKLVIWYSGHGMPPDPDMKYDPGTWTLNGGCYTSTELSDAIKATGVGSTYVFSDSCYSGAFVDRLNCPNTLAIAATQPNQMARENGEVGGGFFTTSITNYLGNGYDLLRAYRMTDVWVGERTKDYESMWQWPSTNTASDSIYGQDFEGTNLDFAYPFGKPLLQEIINDSLELIPDVTGSASKSLQISVSSAPGTVSYVPGGIAICPSGTSFYVTDNTNGKVLMLNPRDSNHRKIPLVDGLSLPGDIDITDDGMSLVYVSGGQAQKVLFGLTGYVLDSQGVPLTGADIIVQTSAGERLGKVDAGGYFTVMNILNPLLSSRTVFVTVISGGASQLYSFDLNAACQTFVTLSFDGIASISTPTPGLPSQTSGGGSGTTGSTTTGAPPSSLVPSIEPPEPEDVPVIPGKTTIVPTQVINEPSSVAVSGGANPRVIIVTPVDEVETNETTLVLTGWISDTKVTQAVVDVNGIQQSISTANGSFAKTIMLVQGLNTIKVKATFPQSGDIYSSPVKVTVSPGFSGATGSVTGRVLNLNGYRGANGVKVVETNTCQQTTTDAEGYYQFTALPVGKARVHVRP